MRRAAVLSACLLACGPEPLRAPPPAPVVEEPALAIPGDLDLVLRIDLARVRGALGLDPSRALDRAYDESLPAERDAGTRRLLSQLLLNTNVLWVGVRPGHSPELTDNVLVARGAFTGIVPNTIPGEPPWQSARDLGGNVRRFERAQPSVRALPAVLYVREPDLVILGSAAEIDALTRTIEQRRGDRPVRAPETGLVSVAARLAPILRRLQARAPALAELLAGSEHLRASADLTAGALRVDVEVSFAAAERAEAAGSALRRLVAALSRTSAPWLTPARVDSIGNVVTGSLVLPETELHRLAAGRQSSMGPDGEH
ncbi:MAG: hypothetical protein DIU78_017000 [Pseudomonadota bacterium]|nr:MAG: hypothetical protein DIU78_05275 [Pseudomonadota bacterium]